jgi:hypothetical protein
MTKTQEKELTFLQSRVNRLSITAPERVAAMDALRNGFIIVERVAWLGDKLTRLGALLFGQRTIRPHYRHG